MRTGYVRIWPLPDMPDAGGKTSDWKETFFFSKVKNLKKLNHKNKIKYDY